MNPAKILIVDDEPAMLRSVERVLGEYDTRSSPSPVEALLIAKEFQPDLAIVDIRMPGMDGFEVMQALKQADDDIQVILMTGSIYDLDEKFIRAIREMAYYYITKPFDREVLQTLVARCAEHQQLEKSNRAYLAQIEQELGEARAFQKTMIPPGAATLSGVRIHAAYVPCVELAGDLYDYAMADEMVSLLIADVVGHGLSAAMLTGVVKSAFHASHVDGYDPVSVVTRVHENIAPFAADRFVTLMCARISAEKRSIEYVNAGHDGGLILSENGEVIELPPTGPFVAALLRDSGWKRKTVAFAPGSLLLFYTDGISEAGDGNHFFEKERIHAIVRETPGGEMPLLNTILSEVHAFTKEIKAADDMTLLTAKYAD